MPRLDLKRTYTMATNLNKLSSETLKQWTKDVEANPTLALAASVASNVGLEEALMRRPNKTFATNPVFNTQIKTLGAPVMNQKQSGRCWLFAATNGFRIKLMEKYNIENLKLSPSFLFFYDKLEKANFFLNQVVDTAKEDVDSRLFQHLLTDPVSDGGQYGMLTNILNKYGLVPDSVFPDSFNTTASRHVNFLVVTQLHQYAQDLREAVERGEDTKALREKQMRQIHQLLVVHFGSPPGPNDEIEFDYIDKDKKPHTIKTTPLKFVSEILEEEPSKSVSLLNDPRNDYERVVHVERLGNVAEAPEVHYFNVDIDVLAQKAIERLKNNKPVFFGTHTPIYHHRQLGIIDEKLWDYEKIGFKPTQNKADRLRYHQSLMTHAMLFVGVHLDDNGKPLRWKIENSWGDETGNKGYYTMTHDFFKEYVYQVVVHENEIPEYKDKLDTKPIDLPPWDPCGSLAKL